MKANFFLILIIIQTSCIQIIKEKTAENPVITQNITDTTPVMQQEVDTLQYDNPSAFRINTGNTTPEELISFAKTMVGTPYLYASSDPAAGFDCSGFITYVFNHFNIAVPRSSVDFTNVGSEVSVADARPGDLILFTGTDSTTGIVGHMGIIISADKGLLEFIHSSSGKIYGVTITPLSSYYKSRFVKVIRIFQ